MGNQSSSGETTCTNTGATINKRSGRGQHSKRLNKYVDGIVKPSPNHWTLRLPNDENDDDGTYICNVFVVVYFNTILAWYVVLSTCSATAAFVSGKYSKVRDNWANSCSRAWLTFATVQYTEYSDMTHLSMTALLSEEGVSGLSVRWQSAVVSFDLVLHFKKAHLFSVQKDMLYEPISEELLPWRTTSYCRCNVLKCFVICFQMKLRFSVNITAERYPSTNYVSVVRNNTILISTTVRHCIHGMQNHFRIELFIVAWHEWIVRLVSAWSRTPQYSIIYSWNYNISLAEDGNAEQLILAYNGTVTHCCLRCVHFQFPCLIPAPPLLYGRCFSNVWKIADPVGINSFSLVVTFLSA